ncbi:hypothetical protein CBGD1_2633 [Sulfurimonas gotlandica GD1]|nr:hypothetical protein CBGD1_2633 [Sulfurimonas gotlandica GD1]
MQDAYDACDGGDGSFNTAWSNRPWMEKQNNSIYSSRNTKCHSIWWLSCACSCGICSYVS